LIAVQNSAAIVRVHDVAITRDALAVWNAVESALSPAAKRVEPSKKSLWDDE
jgi:dihydropteroate synthase